MAHGLAHLPRTAEYVASLPRGLDSFPLCEVRAAVFEPHVRHFGSRVNEPSLPGPVRELFAGRLADRQWVPEVVFQIAFLVVRDLFMPDDEAYSRWTYDVSLELYDKPFLRGLMRLLSPNLAVLGAARRWEAFHRGSQLASGPVTSEGGRATTVGTLRFPDGMFSPAFLRTLEGALLAGIAMARAKEPTVRLTGGTGSGTAAYTLSWKA
jgi:hypothetical protein